MFHSDAKVRDAINRGLCPDCKGPLTVRLDDPRHEVTVICGCRHPLGTVYNQDDVYPEVLELGRRQLPAEHTKTPWEHHHRMIVKGKIYIASTDSSEDFDDEHVKTEHAVSTEEAVANAAFIVRAVNAHEAIVAALKNALKEVEGFEKRTGNIQFMRWIDEVKSALALAEK